MEILLIGILLLMGLVAGTLASRFLGMPRIIGYLLIGALFSPGLLGASLGFDSTDWTQPLVAVALGVIAYVIGGAASPNQLKRLGYTIFAAAVGKVIGAFTAVFVVFWALSVQVSGVDSLSFSLFIAAIATTTAPAAIIAIIHQYRAQGPLSTTLLGVVAVDDVLGIILFSIILAIAGAASFTDAIPHALWDVFGALLAGVVIAYLLTRLVGRLAEPELRLVALLGGIVLLVGLAEVAVFSALLAAMSFGFFARVFGGTHAHRLFEPVEGLEELVFVIFFTFAGLHFEYQVLADYAALIIGYFLLRGLGQIAGASLGAQLAGAPASIRNNVGLGMIPQGGVAIGLALMLASHEQFTEAGAIIVNIIAVSTLLTESLGAIATRYALARAGELQHHKGTFSDEG